MTLRFVAPIALIVSVGAYLAATDGPEEAWATALDLNIVNEVLGLAAESDVDLEIPSEWVELDYVAGQFPQVFRSRLPRRDGWGGELFIIRRDKIVLIASGGANGVLELEGCDALERALEAGPWHWQPRLPTDDIVLVVGRGLINAPLTTRMRQRATIADIRSLGTAIESYAIDNNFYPVQGRDLLGLRGIETPLEPIYIRRMPLADAWGSELLYWSDGRQYLLVAPAADGLVDRDYGVARGALEPATFEGAVDRAEADIVFANGQFVQWPEGRWQ